MVLLGSMVAMALLAGGEPMLGNDTPPDPMTLEQLGPLKGLVGTWEGKFGLQVVRLPRVEEGASAPSAPGVRTADFTTLIQNYMETITFTPIMGAILNRGYEGANQFNPAKMLNQTLLGLMYFQTVNLINEDGSKGPLVHVENGQWHRQVNPGIFDTWEVARFALIPHSPAIIAVGTTEEFKSGHEVLKSQAQAEDAFLTNPLNVGFNVPGYGALPDPGGNPVRKLRGDIGPDLDSMTAVRLSVTTTNGTGTLAMLRNQRAQVLTEEFLTDFWIETVRDSNGTIRYDQLQYAQRVNMNFFAKFSGVCESRSSAANTQCVIDWPHVQVNTLRKTSGPDLPFPMNQSLPPIR